MKNIEATYKTTSSLLMIARRHFTKFGYYHVSLEKIAEEGHVTRGAVYHHFKNKQGLFIAVLESIQRDISLHIEKEAMKSEDPWQQLILGCVEFVKRANAIENRRILLIEAPAILGWDVWRNIDKSTSLSVLQEHIVDLKLKGYLCDNVDTTLMSYAISGALNELSLCYSQHEETEKDAKMFILISQIVNGFKKA